MDEYDELFEVQDDFEEQFADELEVLAEMEGESKTLKLPKGQLAYDSTVKSPSYFSETVVEKWSFCLGVDLIQGCFAFEQCGS